MEPHYALNKHTWCYSYSPQSQVKSPKEWHVEHQMGPPGSVLRQRGKVEGKVAFN